MSKLSSVKISPIGISVRFRWLHDWNVNPAQAIKIQQDLASQVIRQGKLDSVNLVAGVDVGFPNPQIARAAAVVLSYPDMKVVEQAVIEMPVIFPYIPGLLSFREGPAVLAAVGRLKMNLTYLSLTLME